MNNEIRRDIQQLNDNVKVMSSSSVVLMTTILFLVLSVIIWLFAGSVTEKARIKGVVFPDTGISDISIPQAGVVRSIFVQKGQQVNEGQRIALVSVGDSYSVLTSTSDGIVFSSKQDNDSFDAFEPVASLIADGTGQVMLLAYSDLTNLKDIAPGQSVQVWPSNEKTDEVGYVRGKVTGVSRFPVEKTEASRKIKFQDYTNALFQDNTPYYEINVMLEENPNQPGLLNWTFDKDHHPDMSAGTLCDAIVITHKYSIFEYLFLKAKRTGNKVKAWVE